MAAKTLNLHNNKAERTQKLTTRGPSLNPSINSALNSLGRSHGSTVGLLASSKVHVVLLKSIRELASKDLMNRQGRRSL